MRLLKDLAGRQVDRSAGQAGKRVHGVVDPSGMSDGPSPTVHLVYYSPLPACGNEARVDGLPIPGARHMSYFIFVVYLLAAIIPGITGLIPGEGGDILTIGFRLHQGSLILLFSGYRKLSFSEIRRLEC